MRPAVLSLASGTQERKMSANDTIRRRINARIADLDMPITRVATEAGLERSYLSEYLSGKKQSIRAESVLPLAQVLQCDAAFLLGTQDRPRQYAAEGQAAFLPVRGIIENNAWRDVEPDGETSPLVTDPRWSDDQQFAMKVVGESANRIAANGAFLHIVAGDVPMVDGAVVVIRRKHAAGGLFETSLRIVRVSGAVELWSTSSKIESVLPLDKSIEVVGRPIAIYTRLD